MTNPILRTDSYKISQARQYPPGTTELMAYMESRGSAIGKPGTIFFGLQIFLDKLTQRITMKDVEKAKAFTDAHIGPGIFPYEGWKYVVKELDGKIPLEIYAVPEGSYVPCHNILLRVRSTDPKVSWLVSWFETQIVRAVWYPTTTATISNAVRELIYQSLLETSDNADELILSRLHDFAARGVSSGESAEIGGAAHLVNFAGSDTIEGVLCANEHYAADMAGFSIPASEHSTITTWGRDHEVDAYRNMLTQFAKPDALVACVSDSYDIYKAITELWGKQLRQEVIDSGATLIVRVDSGDPTAMVIEALELLEQSFGTTLNSKGYKVLNHNVRLIQGDGVNEGSIRLILFKTKQHGFATDNIGFGMGGALLQQHNRDTFKFAYKVCQAVINGKTVPVYKDPITDPGKRSKSGMLDLVKVNGEYQTVDRSKIQPATYMMGPSELIQVFLNGEITHRYTLAEIRARVDERIKAICKEPVTV